MIYQNHFLLVGLYTSHTHKDNLTCKFIVRQTCCLFILFVFRTFPLSLGERYVLVASLVSIRSLPGFAEKRLKDVVLEAAEETLTAVMQEEEIRRQGESRSS